MKLFRNLFPLLAITLFTPVLVGAICIPTPDGGQACEDSANTPMPVPFRVETGNKDFDPAATLIGSTFEWARYQGSLGQPLRSSGCGIVAAEALVRFRANNAGLDKINEIWNIAQQNNYWDANNGMHGPYEGGEQGLLRKLGIEAEVTSSNMSLKDAETKLKESLARNNPVIVSTLSHYFFVEGTCADGTFFVGNTGKIKTGAVCMNISAIYNSGGDPLILLIPR